MKRAISIICILLLLIGMETKAEDNPYGDPQYQDVSAYCIDGITASGQHTRYGICAGKPEWLGMTAIIYYEDELIGIFEIEDTGGKKILSGERLDIWLPTEEECFQWGVRKCRVQIIKAEG